MTKKFYYNTAGCLARFAQLLTGGRVYDATGLSWVCGPLRQWEPDTYMRKAGITERIPPPKWWNEAWDRRRMSIWLSAYVLHGMWPTEMPPDVPAHIQAALPAFSSLLRGMGGEEYLDWQSGSLICWMGDSAPPDVIRDMTPEEFLQRITPSTGEREHEHI